MSHLRAAKPLHENTETGKARPEGASLRSFVFVHQTGRFQMKRLLLRRKIYIVFYVSSSAHLMFRDSSCNEVKQFLPCGFREYKAEF